MILWAWLGGLLIFNRIMEPVLDCYERARRTCVTGRSWLSWRWWRA